MAYVLGIDLGTTYSAAAVFENNRAEIVQLGTRQATIPSVVLLRDDGEVLVGEAAERRALAEPERVAREFKRRLGDPVPLILGGTPYGAEALIAHLLRSIVATVSQLKGEPPDVVAITHPASYGPYKLDLLQQAVRQAEIRPVTFLSEPEAAAVHYAEQERISPGAAVAVYDFGGGTFDAAVVRHRDGGWELLGEGEGLERLGGMDFDEAVFAHVRSSLEGKLEELSPNLPASTTSIGRLRSECIQAKETLSEDTESTIPVLLPNIQTDIRLTRLEFEGMIRPRIRETITALERAVRSSGLTMAEIDRVLLVGGSSRIPLVAQIVRESTDRPVALDAQPKHAIALGAAVIAEQQRSSGGVSSAVPLGAEASLPPSDPSAEESAEPTPEVVAQPAAISGGAQPPIGVSSRSETSGSGRSLPLPALAVIPLALIAVAVAAIFLLGGGGDDDAAGQAIAGSPTATVSPDPSPTVQASETQAAVVSPTEVDVAAPQSAAITGISVASGRYYVDFAVSGFEADIQDVHVHFFFDSVPPLEAGVPGQGLWIIHDVPSPFTGYAVSDRPSGAGQMCILVANPDHSVRQGTGNCLQLP